MRAITHDRYGSPDLLRLRELDTPAIGPDEVLIRARAASLHPGDLFSVLGSPFPVRFVTGLRRPKFGVPGLDVAGVVEAVGGGVTHLRPGDEVFGCGFGTCAELVRAKADLVVAKPPQLSFEEAAAIPTSALAALHGLRDAGRVQPGQRVLDQRRVGRRRVVRGADRQGAREPRSPACALRGISSSSVRWVPTT